MLWSEQALALIAQVAIGDRPEGVTCKHEHGRRESPRAKLSDGKTPVTEVWNCWVVRCDGVVLGEGTSEKMAWADATIVSKSIMAKMSSDA